MTNVKTFQVGEKVIIVNLVSNDNEKMSPFSYRKIGMCLEVIAEENDKGLIKVRHTYTDKTSAVTHVFPHNLKSIQNEHEPIPLPKVSDYLLAGNYINFCQKYKVEDMPFNSYARMMRAKKCQLTGADLDITTATVICSDPSRGFIVGNVVACHKDMHNAIESLTKSVIGIKELTSGLIKLAKVKGGNVESRDS
jgi:hypothetical protein